MRRQNNFATFLSTGRAPSDAATWEEDWADYPDLGVAFDAVPREVNQIHVDPPSPSKRAARFDARVRP